MEDGYIKVEVRCSYCGAIMVYNVPKSYYYFMRAHNKSIDEPSICEVCLDSMSEDISV